MGARIPDDELAEIMGLYEQGLKAGYSKLALYETIGAQVGRSPGVISAVCRRLRPTVNLAQVKLKAAAARLVDRVIAKANVEEAMDLLSRPNIGVLEPMKGNQAGEGGFFMSVSADSCGAVKIGVQMGNAPALAPAPAVSEPPPVLDITPIPQTLTPPTEPAAPIRRSLAMSLARAKERLEAAKAKAGVKPDGRRRGRRRTTPPVEVGAESPV